MYSNLCFKKHFFVRFLTKSFKMCCKQQGFCGFERKTDRLLPTFLTKKEK